jgi:tetratricopeptide (TPR) repeat protein
MRLVRIQGLILYVSVMALLFAAPTFCLAKDISLVVLPLKNDTGDESLDWLSVGLQDAMTIDLWYVKGLNTLAVSQYISAAGTFPKGISEYSRHEALDLGKELSLDQVWVGSYKNSENDTIIVEIKGVDVATGNEVFNKDMSGPLEDLPSLEPVLVMEILKELNIQVSEKAENRMTGVKTKSLAAFELNARGYHVQHKLSLIRERGKYYEEWVSLLRRAVREDPDYAEAWNNLGWALRTSGLHPMATDAFTRALKLKPYLIDANMGMGVEMKFDRKGAGKALSYIGKAVDLNRSLGWPREELKKIVFDSRDNSALPYLVNFAKSDDKDTRKAAVESIRKIGGKAAKKHLKEARRHNSLIIISDIRKKVEMGDHWATYELTELLKHEDKDVRLAAVVALGELEDIEAVPELKRVAQKDKSERVRVRALISLAYMGDEDAVESLAKIIDKSNRRLRKYIVEGILKKPEKFHGTGLEFLVRE